MEIKEKFIQIRLVFFIQLMLQCHLALAGDTQSANNQGKAFAQSMNQSSVNQSAAQMNPNTVPGYQGANIPEAQYYHSSNIESDAQQKASTDSNAQYINNAHNQRPQISLQPDTDPLFKRQKEIETQSQSLSSTYSGCVNLPVGSQDVVNTQDKSCYITGRQDQVQFACTKTLNVSCSAKAGQPNSLSINDFMVSGDAGFPKGSSAADNFWFGSLTNNRNASKKSCNYYRNSIQVYLADLSQIAEFVITQLQYDDWLDVSVNGALVFRGLGANQGLTLGNNYACEQRKMWTASNIDLKSKLIIGWNRIDLVNSVTGGGNAYLNIRARRIFACEPISTSYSRSCSSGENYNQANLISSVCSSGAATHQVNGFPIRQDCWAWQETYSRLSDPIYTKDATCAQLESQGCGQKSARCIAFNGIFCNQQEITYSCSSTSAARHVSLCGSQLVCPDGQCTADIGQTYTPATENFKQAATGLAVANEIAQHFNKTTLTLFAGSSKQCSKASLGYADCCKDSGWGVDIGLANCSSDEQQLGLAKQAGRTHFIGSYTSGGLLDKKTHYVYCLYPSQLSRLIIEQGKPQLKQSFGSARAPNCSGFGLTELDALNFDAMDFSAVYGDAINKAANSSAPSATQASQQIQQKLKAQYSQIDQGGH